jgi:hypothetical protein
MLIYGNMLPPIGLDVKPYHYRSYRKAGPAAPSRKSGRYQYLRHINRYLYVYVEDAPSVQKNFSKSVKIVGNSLYLWA